MSTLAEKHLFLVMAFPASFVPLKEMGSPLKTREPPLSLPRVSGCIPGMGTKGSKVEGEVKDRPLDGETLKHCYH